MALKDQPYLPIYIQDVLTDEKLMLCSASSHGIYFRLLCTLHKQPKYGMICLHQRFSKTESKFLNFAQMLVRYFPFNAEEIQEALEELSDEGVIQVTETELMQKRMVKDGELSLMRSEIGKTGGSPVTRQYGKPGFIYLMSDGFTKHKIGISINPKNRLYRLRSDLKLPKHFDIKKSEDVYKMGESEDAMKEAFVGRISGEWVEGSFDDVVDIFDSAITKIKAKQQTKNQANTEYESDNENEGDTVILNDQGFENWFSVYGKMVGEHQCSIYWRRFMKPQEKEMCEKITPLYVQATPDIKFRKDPLKFLQGKFYMDKDIITNYNKNNHDWIAEAFTKI